MELNRKKKKKIFLRKTKKVIFILRIYNSLGNYVYLYIPTINSLENFKEIYPQ